MMLCAEQGASIDAKENKKRKHGTTMKEAGARMALI